MAGGGVFGFRVKHLVRTHPDQVGSSNTFALVDDWSCFVSEFFNVITEPSVRILHSALAVAPRTLIVQKLDGQYPSLFMSIVHQEGGEKRKESTYRSYVPNLYNLLN